MLVQSANLDMLLLPFELAFHHMMIGAAVHLDAQPAVSPQLSLGAEPVCGLQNTQQDCRPDRTKRRNLREPLPDHVLLAPSAHPRFADFPKPRATMPRAIYLLAAANNSPTAIDGLHPRHNG